MYMKLNERMNRVNILLNKIYRKIIYFMRVSTNLAKTRFQLGGRDVDVDLGET